MPSPVEDGRLANITMAEIMDGKEVRDRLPIPLTVVTKNNVGSVEPAGTDQERMVPRGGI
ncbi:hypothetical protein [Mesorhizobium sp. ES1-3]|uniref:hypothetical protein n=1 Tax=Mesorhizobium sp. ES1-3 TaxID=2876628 RepID=UPI001CCBA369|nr:hypothetical protein [Mesorhizobium sp. ES1-3]MBZ9673507.1 hypothetical protein [Mesorhizobium sp. ES1-3]